MQARIAIGLVASAAFAAGAASAQGEEPELTPMDYVEIEQLVVRYAYALDTGSNDGYDYADLFAADGVFVGMNQGAEGRSYRGREVLASLARGGARGPANVGHFITNMRIEVTPEGVKGRQYAVIASIGANGEPSRITHGGHYEDVYVKTPEGWRFRSRVFYASEGGADPKQLQHSPLDAPPGGG